MILICNQYLKRRHFTFCFSIQSPKSSVATLQMLNSHMRLLTAILNKTFRYMRSFNAELSKYYDNPGKGDEEILRPCTSKMWHKFSAA